MIRLALSARGSVMSSLRAGVRKLLKEKVRIYTGYPPAEAATFRNDMLNLFLTPGCPADAHRRTVIENLFNGDWRITDEIQYYDHGQIAGGPAAVMRAFYTHGVRALFPRVLRVLQRSNWCGTAQAMDDMGLPTVIHGVLPAAYLASCTSKMPDRTSSGPAAPPLVAGLAIEDDEEDWGEGQAGDAQQASNVQLPTVDGDPQSLWRLEQDSHIQSSRAWAASGQMADDLIMGKLLY